MKYILKHSVVANGLGLNLLTHQIQHEKDRQKTNATNVTLHFEASRSNISKYGVKICNTFHIQQQKVYNKNGQCDVWPDWKSLTVLN